MSETRSIRKFSDKQIKGTLTARKCECCGHHEIGIHTDQGRFVALRPGMVLTVASQTSSQKRRNRIYVPTQDPDDWRRLLADPEKHWRTGYSAKALAHCWEKSNGFPDEIARLFHESDIPRFKGTELLLAIPEHKVSLPGGAHPSQNDLFALAGAREQLITIMVEGKASECFGPAIDKWLADASPGKRKRLQHLKDQLGLKCDFPPFIRYQLIHRAASAVIEAQRFTAKTAVIIVQSFSQEDLWFDDYQKFLALFGAEAFPGKLSFLNCTKGVDLYAGWARGDSKYLKM